MPASVPDTETDDSVRDYVNEKLAEAELEYIQAREDRAAVIAAAKAAVIEAKAAASKTVDEARVAARKAIDQADAAARKTVDQAKAAVAKAQKAPRPQKLDKAELAAAIDMSPFAFSRRINGHDQFTADEIVRLARYFHVSVDKVLSGHGVSAG